MSISPAGPLALFALIWLIQVMTPGPNFVRISHTALTVSRRAAMETALGTAAGHCVWCVAAALGAALLMKNPALRGALHVLGAIYLGWFGTRLLLGVVRGRSKRQVTCSGAQGLEAFRRGFTTAIANPQVLVFFGTVFVAMFPKLTGILILTAAIIVACVTLAWYACVTMLLTAGPARRAYERARPLIDLMFAALLWLAAVRLILAWNA